MHQQLAASGAHVIATARDLTKAPGLQSLLQTHGEGPALQVVTLDVADAASVKVRTAQLLTSAPTEAPPMLHPWRCTDCAGQASGRPMQPSTGHSAVSHAMRKSTGRCSMSQLAGDHASRRKMS